MSRTTAGYIGYYAILAAAIFAAANLLFWGLDTWGLDTWAPGVLAQPVDRLSTGNIVLLVPPPMLTGQRFFTRERRAMTRAEIWRLAALAALAWLIIAFSGGVAINLAVFGVWHGMADLDAIAAGAGTAAVFLAAGFIFVVLVNRVMFWIGMRVAKRRAACWTIRK